MPNRLYSQGYLSCSIYLSWKTPNMTWAELNILYHMRAPQDDAEEMPILPEPHSFFELVN